MLANTTGDSSNFSLYIYIYIYIYINIYLKSTGDAPTTSERSTILMLNSFALVYSNTILRGNTAKQSFTMMTSSNGNIFRVTGPLCGDFTGHRWIPHTKASDAELWCFLWFGAFFGVFCAWLNGWVNIREAGDLRRHRAHYDVIVRLRLHHVKSCPSVWE